MPDLAKKLVRLQRTFAAVRHLCPELPVLAIAWLQIKHPLHPVQETLLENAVIASGAKQSVSKAGFDRLLRSARNDSFYVVKACRSLVYAVYLGFRILRIHWMLRRDISELNRQSFDTALKTWGFGADLAAKSTDFYYGDLSQKLAAQGLSAILLCGDAGSLGGITFARRYTSLEMPKRLSELALLRAWDPLVMIWHQWGAMIKMRRLAARAKQPLLHAVLKAGAGTVCDPQTTRDALQYKIAAEAVRRWKLTSYVTLYEGHGWEKCAWWGAKTANPACRTVGYQHTAIFQESLALLHPIIDQRNRSLPNLALSIGQIPLELLRPTHEPHHCALDVMGSFRYQSSSITAPANANHPWILVTPEGLPEEMIRIFNFVYGAAKAMPKATFVIRTHPAAPLSTVLHALPPDFLKAHNLIISQEKDIGADFRRCSFLLYRGSSTVLYAILQGLRPVYLHIPGKIDTDPLYNLELWRLSSDNVQGFAALIAREPTLDPTQRGADWRAAAEYVNRYTMPFQDGSLSYFKAAQGKLS